MNPNTPDGGSSGQLIGVSRSIPPTILKCEGWESDIPDDQWCQGTLEGVTRSLPVASPGFSEELSGTSVWLEISVSFDEHTQPAQVVEQSKRLVGIAQAGDPTLGLFYDFHRSRTENDLVVIALSTRSTSDIETRLHGVAEIILREATQLPELRKLVATVTRGAAAA
jgi:hypothetical protein